MEIFSKVSPITYKPIDNQFNEKCFHGCYSQRSSIFNYMLSFIVQRCLKQDMKHKRKKIIIKKVNIISPAINASNDVLY